MSILCRINSVRQYISKVKEDNSLKEQVHFVKESFTKAVENCINEGSISNFYLMIGTMDTHIVSGKNHSEFSISFRIPCCEFSKMLIDFVKESLLSAHYSYPSISCLATERSLYDVLAIKSKLSNEYFSSRIQLNYSYNNIDDLFVSTEDVFSRLEKLDIDLLEKCIAYKNEICTDFLINIIKKNSNYILEFNVIMPSIYKLTYGNELNENFNVINPIVNEYGEIKFSILI